MFGNRGEKVGGGEKLSRKQAQRVGENVKDAVNAGVGEQVEDLEGYFASGDDFGVDPGMAANIAAVNRVAGLFDDDEKLQKKIKEKWAAKQARMERENSWNNFVGKALKAKEKEVGSMLTDEEREEAKRAELEKKVAEKARGNKGFLRVKRKVVAGLIGSLAGITMFLSACGVSTEKEVHMATTMTLGNEDDEGEGSDDGASMITAEMAGEGTVETEDETETTEATSENETMRSLEEILELSKDLDFSQITPEELEMVGRDEALTAEFELSEESRVLENGLQVNYANGYYSSDKTGKNKFGPSAVEAYDDAEATVDSMMRAYFSQPQELAAGVVDFESVLRAAGVDEEVIAIDGVLERAQAVYEQMLNREDGGDLQARLRGALKIALMSDRTSFNFYYENRAENSFYLRALDASTTESPETNLVLMGNELQRHGAKQVQIVLDFGDHQETMDYNLDCGWQPNWNEHWRPKQEIVTVTPEEPETPPETSPEEPETPPETPPEEPETPPETPPEEPETPPETPPEEPETPPETPPEEPETPPETPPEEPETPPETPPEEPETPPETPPEEPETPPETPPEEPETPPETPPEEPETPPETSPEEPVKPKDDEGQNEVVDNGIHSDPVDETGNLNDMTEGEIQTPSNETPENQIPQDQITGDTTGTYDVTEEPVMGGSSDSAENESMGDSGLSEEEQTAADEEQNEAEATENLEGTDMTTPEDFAKFFEDFMNGLV